MLTQEKLKEIFHYDPDTGLFIRLVATTNRTKVGDICGCKNKAGYLRIRIDGTLYYSHILAYLYVNGEFPIRDIDHINRDKTDNRWENLRLATDSENNQNKDRPVSNTTGFMGVCYHKKRFKYQANIKIDGKQKHLGYFDNPEEAHEAYIAAKKIHHPFANISQQ